MQLPRLDPAGRGIAEQLTRQFEALRTFESCVALAWLNVCVAVCASLPGTLHCTAFEDRGRH